MGLNFNNKEYSSIKFKGKQYFVVKYKDNNGNDYMWAAQYTYTTGTLPAHVTSVKCYRIGSVYAGAPGTTDDPVEILNNGEVFYGDVVTWEATAGTGYTAHVDLNPFTVTGNLNGVTQSDVILAYSVYIASNNTGYGTVDISTISDVPSGATISVNDNKLTVDHAHMPTAVVTATPAARTGQYTYSFVNWTYPSSGKVTGITNVTANFTRSVNQYPVTIAAGRGIKEVYLSTDQSATSGSASGTYFNYGTTVYGFVKLAAGYNHADGWIHISGTEDSENAIYRLNTTVVVGAE